jgi:UDP-glucose:glycoprotein glucosyltransferase
VTYPANLRLRYEVSPGVDFADLPSTPIFTLGMDTPPSWVVSPSTSPYDLDNLVLGLIHNSAEVLFVLKQLLIEGHAREANNVPPRGLQLQLSRNGLEVASDTQVMANLGYFQFKATPGLYHLAIRPGRGTEVYDLESVGNEGWASPSVNETGTAVVLSSFEGKTILPRFDRRLGMEAANVLLEDAVATSPSSLASTFLSTLADRQSCYKAHDRTCYRLKSIVGLTNTETSLTTRHADINIFTVASGLLYEVGESLSIKMC